MLHASSVFSPTSARKCWRGVSKRRTPFSLSLFLCFSVSRSLSRSLFLSCFLIRSLALYMSVYDGKNLPRDIVPRLADRRGRAFRVPVAHFFVESSRAHRTGAK